MNKRSSFPIAVYLFFVFVIGALVGAFGYRLYTVTAVSAVSRVNNPTQDERRQRFVNDLRQRLNLDSDQLQKLGGILDECRAKARVIHKQIDPQMTALRRAQEDKIRAILNPQQQPEFDRWRADRIKAEQQAAK